METARSILKNLSAGSEELPDEEAYFRRQRQLHFAHAFGDLVKDMRNAAPADKQPQLTLSAKRLAYRYISQSPYSKNHSKFFFVRISWIVLT